MQTLLGNNLTYIGDYVSSAHEAKPHFAIFHTHIDKGDPIDFFLMENKTLRYDQTKVEPIQEKGNNIPTMSLFGEYFYIFNAGRLSLFKWKLVDVPYLLLFHISKSTDISDITNALEKIHQCTDMTTTVLTQKKNLTEVINMFYSLDIIKVQAQDAHQKHIISGEVVLPESAPRKYNIPIPVTVNGEYLKLLKEDQSFEKSIIQTRF